MLNISFLACTKVELWYLTVCIAVNGEKFRSGTVTLVRQCPISNLSEIFSYTTMCSNFMFLDQFFLSYHAKTHAHKHRRTQTRTHTHTATLTSTP